MRDAPPTLPSPEAQRERRTYAPPRLTVHGSASDLTAGVTGGTSDGKSGSAQV
jgi:hypothetical protein